MRSSRITTRRRLAMGLVEHAGFRAEGRLQGIIESGAGGGSTLSMVAATTAGTDVDGPELTSEIGASTDRALSMALPPLLEAFAGKVAADELRDTLYRHLNGAALMWF